MPLAGSGLLLLIWGLLGRSQDTQASVAQQGRREGRKQGMRREGTLYPGQSHRLPLTIPGHQVHGVPQGREGMPGSYHGG